MVKWGRRFVLLIAILAVLAGTVYALDWLGVIKVQDLLAKIPGGSKLSEMISGKTAVPSNSKAATNSTRATGVKTGVNLTDEQNKLQEENKQLKAQLANLQKQLAALKTQNTEMAKKQSDLEQQLLDQANAQDAKATKESGFKQLAGYYAEMKPKEAVAIMDRLDDDTVIGILINLPSDQTAKILAAMDPKRAARLVNKLTM